MELVMGVVGCKGDVTDWLKFGSWLGQRLVLVVLGTAWLGQLDRGSGEVRQQRLDSAGWWLAATRLGLRSGKLV
ncbi:hypothetical protein V6N12_058248 [Hibiscus sabdariffa]|uniref:Uncharacterized protein n=1 Tax=Hibiscus sabdariffa TaxID=183260 RepID=A0ABR2ES27_9ROSI